MPPQQSHILDYDACSADELRGFIEGRLGKFSRASRRGRPKRLYVETLKRLDRDITFHKFLGLPPELRLLVYRELLVYDPVVPLSWSPTMAILATCKLVKKEAEDVFHAENEVTFDLKIWKDECERAALLPGIYRCRKRTERPRSILSALQAFPSRLARIRHAHVKVCMDTTLRVPEQQPNIHHEARFQCSVLAPFLAQTQARTVKVQLASPSSVFEMNFYVLQPLAQLGPKIRITFTGVPLDAADKLKALRSCAPYPHDIRVDKVLVEWFKTFAGIQKELEVWGPWEKRRTAWRSRRISTRSKIDSATSSTTTQRPSSDFAKPSPS